MLFKTLAGMMALSAKGSAPLAVKGSVIKKSLPKALLAAKQGTAIIPVGAKGFFVTYPNMAAASALPKAALASGGLLATSALPKAALASDGTLRVATSALPKAALGGPMGTNGASALLAR